MLKKYIRKPVILYYVSNNIFENIKTQIKKKGNNDIVFFKSLTQQNHFMTIICFTLEYGDKKMKIKGKKNNIRHCEKLFTENCDNSSVFFVAITLCRLFIP